MKAKLPALPPPPINTERLRASFNQYLLNEHYTLLTANKTSRTIDSLIEFARAGAPLPDTFRIYGIRALRWLRELQSTKAELIQSPLAKGLSTWLESVLAGEEIVDPAPKKRRDKPDKLTVAQWKQLVEYAQLHAEESPEAAVLRVMLFTPLRIGKVLVMPLRELRDTLRNEVVKAQLTRFLEGRHKDLAAVLDSPTQNAAYVRMKRFTTALSEEFGFDFDFNTIARSRLDQAKGVFGDRAEVKANYNPAAGAQGNRSRYGD